MLYQVSDKTQIEAGALGSHIHMTDVAVQIIENSFYYEVKHLTNSKVINDVTLSMTILATTLISIFSYNIFRHAKMKQQNSRQANREVHLLQLQTRKVKSLSKINAKEILKERLHMLCYKHQE